MCFVHLPLYPYILDVFRYLVYRAERWAGCLYVKSPSNIGAAKSIMFRLLLRFLLFAQSARGVWKLLKMNIGPAWLKWYTSSSL